MTQDTDGPRALPAAEVKRRLSEASGEIALLDVAEHGQYGGGHPFLAVPLPYSRLELEAPRLLPCRDTPLVLVDRDDGVAERAARRLAALGYRDVARLAGGAAGWAAAGFTLFEGVHVPSKAFGELLEAALHTPRLTAAEMARMREAGEPVVQLDGRPLGEYRKMTVPGALCCPNAELAHRLPALAADPSVPIVVSCAGRTRSILGAESLRLAGAPNPVYALENGTQGWVLAGLELEHGAERRYPEALDPAALEASRSRARDLIARRGIPLIDAAALDAWAGDVGCSLYVLDVRTPEEFEAGHHPLARSAPGGQLVQATDLWIGVRDARIVLLDDTGLRAAVAAVWLRAMGHRAVVLDPEASRDTWSASPEPAAAPAAPPLPPIAPEALAGEGVQVVDLRPSTAFRRRHIVGALWSIRPRLPVLALEPGRPLALTAETPEIAALAAVDLRELGHEALSWLPPDETAWAAAGLSLQSGDMPGDAEAIDYLFHTHDRHAGNLDAMRGYLAWEIGLVEQIDAQERAVFDLEPLTG